MPHGILLALERGFVEFGFGKPLDRAPGFVTNAVDITRGTVSIVILRRRDCYTKCTRGVTVLASTTAVDWRGVGIVARHAHCEHLNTNISRPADLKIAYTSAATLGGSEIQRSDYLVPRCAHTPMDTVNQASDTLFQADSSSILVEPSGKAST